MYNPIEENEVNCIHYQDSMVIKSISDLLITYIPRNYSCLVILCIGTDRSTGDSLGPLNGTLLTQLTPRNLHVYGTLHQPVHAINLEETIHHIKTSYTKPFIIAVEDRKSTRLNSSHVAISYAVFCLRKKKQCSYGLCC